MNQEYQTAQLANILVEPALSGAIERAQTAKTDGVHWQYKHPNIGISSIAQASPQANTASIEAQVEEDAQYYEGAQIESRSLLFQTTIGALRSRPAKRSLVH